MSRAEANACHALCAAIGAFGGRSTLHAGGPHSRMGNALLVCKSRTGLFARTPQSRPYRRRWCLRPFLTCPETGKPNTMRSITSAFATARNDKSSILKPHVAHWSGGVAVKRYLFSMFVCNSIRNLRSLRARITQLESNSSLPYKRNRDLEFTNCSQGTTCMRNHGPTSSSIPLSRLPNPRNRRAAEGSARYTKWRAISGGA